MNISETYFLAHTARAKLSREAGRPDHNLRLLVGHANMLDSLMLDLAGAEQAQGMLHNQSASAHPAKTSTPAPERHIRWADTVVDVAIEDSDSEDASSDSDESEDDDDDDDGSDYGQDDQFFIDVTPTQLSPVVSTTTATTTSSLVDHDEEVEFEDDLEDDYEDLALTRTNSHPQQPPELLSDDESEEDELSPPSPPQLTFDHFSPEEAIVTSTLYPRSSSTTAKLSQPLLSKSDQPSLLDHRFMDPPRPQERAVAAC